MEEKRSIWVVIGPLIGVVLLYFAISSVVDFYRAGIMQIEIDELVAQHVENVTQEPAAPVEEAPAAGETAVLTETAPITETTALTESAVLTETTPVTESALLTETVPLTETTPITETTP